MKKLIPLLCLLAISQASFSQIHPVKTGEDSTFLMGQPPQLSQQELMSLKSMPPLPVPPLYDGPDAPVLPPSLDNSQHPFFRPVFNQAGYSCGQATFTSHNFTYEINRLRNLPSNLPDNQYPTHFSWNWINGGNGWYGGSYFHTGELLKHVGTPNVTTYGGMSEGGGTRWMSGYDNYYQAMQNRIYDAFSIDVSTIEGLNILKHYLHDHLEGSLYGGVASFYANQPSLYNLPAGTPEAGKKVVISWSNSSHAMTIVGYNDSIRWDYNGDGQYTNHLDINGDGVVDLRDWEIGGLIMVNTFGGVPNWGDGGFAYMMYKTLADPFGAGGIWNNAVHVVKPKENTEPQLTMKVTLKHTSRDKVKVTAGLSLDPNATSPTIEMDFPIFDFQGGNRFMQGGTGEADKTIEFGLDITPLLSHVPSGQTARYFLRVYEKDPNNIGTGEVLFFSVRDYTNGINEFISNHAPTPIIDNGVTTLWVNAAVNYSPVVITTEALPDAKIYEPCEFNLQASGGSQPYHWYMKYDYDESTQAAGFPQVNAQQLSPTNNTSGYATAVLDFEFPFFGERYDTIYLHVNGLVLFDRQNYPWPYFGEPMIQFRGYRGISVFNRDLRLYSGQGIWYEGDENSATFRWKASVNGNQSTDLNFAVKLYPDGKIEYYYGNMNYPVNTEWIGGLSKGDYRSYQLTSNSGAVSIPIDSKIELLAPDYVYEMELLSDGTFKGHPTSIYTNSMLKFMAVDNNNLFKTKTLSFSTRGFKIDYTVQSGGNNIIGYGETAIMDITLISMEPDTIKNATMELSIDDPYIVFTDSLEHIASIAPGDSIVYEAAFIFNVSNQVPNNHPLPFELNITSDDDNWARDIPLTAFAPVVEPSYVIIQDGNNGILDPGETTDILVFFKNSGGTLVNNVHILIESNDPDITVNSDSAFISSIAAGAGQFASFNITASTNLETGQMVTLDAFISGDNDYQNTGIISIVTGILVENFESGSFGQFPWQFGGNQPWIIDNTNAFEGDHSARSGPITHNQVSEMFMDITVTVDDSISFYRKVSSESGYDFLNFYIDNTLMAQWSGEVLWNEVSFPVNEGLRTIKWTYSKDQSVSSGSDRAWVDFITFPPMLTVNAGEDMQVCEGSGAVLAGSASNYTSVLWTSSGNGTFSNSLALNSEYTPSADDILAGSVILTLTATHTSNSLADSIMLIIHPMAEAYTGDDAQVCEGQSHSLAEATASNYTNLIWTTSGNGSFSNPSILNPVYTPGSLDISNGYAILTLLAFSEPPCDNAFDNMILTISSLPEGGAGEDDTCCFGDDYYVGDATASNYDGVFWTSSGSGTFDDITLVNPTYTPSFADYEAGQVILSMNISGIPPCGNISDDMTLFIAGIPSVPLMPSGPDSVNLAQNDTSVYNTSPVAEAISYTWMLQPGEAGIIEGSDTTATVFWNDEFSGYAEISVMAVNNCGESEYSGSFETWVYTSTIGIAAIEMKPLIAVSPNPSSGLFRISSNKAFNEAFTVNIHNILGTEVYYQEVKATSDKEIEINPGHLTEGVYLLILRSGRFTSNHKLMIRR